MQLADQGLAASGWGTGEAVKSKSSSSLAQEQGARGSLAAPRR
jgi:hypothetical protein